MVILRLPDVIRRRREHARRQMYIKLPNYTQTDIILQKNGLKKMPYLHCFACFFGGYFIDNSSTRHAGILYLYAIVYGCPVAHTD